MANESNEPSNESIYIVICVHLLNNKTTRVEIIQKNLISKKTQHVFFYFQDKYRFYKHKMQT